MWEVIRSFNKELGNEQKNRAEEQNNWNEKYIRKNK